MNRRNYTHKRVKKRRTLRGGSRNNQNTLNKNLVREAIGGGPKVMLDKLNTRLQAKNVQKKKSSITLYVEAFNQISGIDKEIEELPEITRGNYKLPELGRDKKKPLNYNGNKTIKQQISELNLQKYDVKHAAFTDFPDELQSKMNQINDIIDAYNKRNGELTINQKFFPNLNYNNLTSVCSACNKIAEDMLDKWGYPEDPNWGKIEIGANQQIINLYNFINTKIASIENFINEKLRSGDKKWSSNSWRRSAREEQKIKLKRGQQRLKFIKDIGEEFSKGKSGDQSDVWNAKKKIYDKTLSEFVLGQPRIPKEYSEEQKKIEKFKYLINLIKRKINSRFHSLSEKNNPGSYNKVFNIKINDDLNSLIISDGKKNQKIKINEKLKNILNTAGAPLKTKLEVEKGITATSETIILGLDLFKNNCYKADTAYKEFISRYGVDDEDNQSENDPSELIDYLKNNKKLLYLFILYYNYYNFNNNDYNEAFSVLILENLIANDSEKQKISKKNKTKEKINEGVEKIINEICCPPESDENHNKGLQMISEITPQILFLLMDGKCMTESEIKEKIKRLEESKTEFFESLKNLKGSIACLEDYEKNISNDVSGGGNDGETPQTDERVNTVAPPPVLPPTAPSPDLLLAEEDKKKAAKEKKKSRCRSSKSKSSSRSRSSKKSSRSRKSKKRSYRKKNR